MSIDTGKRGIIVIDKEIYPGVTCCEWQDEFPNIAEFDIAILNMTVVHEESYLAKEKWKSLRKMLDKLRSSDGTIYFIINEKSFLEWDEFSPYIELQKGKTIKINDENLIPYLSLISPWRFIISGCGKRVRVGYSRMSKTSYTTVCSTSYKDDLAIKVNGRYYLPIPAKKSVQEGINVLLHDVFKIKLKKTTPPKWFQEILLPGEDKILDSIRSLDKKIANLKIEKKKFTIKLENNKEIKSILYEKDAYLESSVTKVLRLLSIDADNISDQRKADIKIRTKNDKIILVEVKGGEKGLTRGHLRQLSDWMMEYWEKYAVEPKGLIILNPFHLDSPEERKDYYPVECIRIAEKRNQCLMTTMDLFKVLSDFMNNKIITEEIEKRILNTSGSWE